MLKIIILSALLTTTSDNVCEEESRSYPVPTIELIQKRAYKLKTELHPQDAKEIAIASEKVATTFDIPITLVLALIEIESRYDKKAKSKKGCRGLTQLSKNTASFLAKKFNIPNFDFHNITDNIFLGVAYLHQLSQQHGGLLIGLTVYNKGIVNWIINPTISKYARGVFRRHNYLNKLLKTEPVNTCSKM